MQPLQQLNASLFVWETFPTTKKRNKTTHRCVCFVSFDLIASLFKDVKINYYGFFTLIFFLFYTKPEKSSFFKILCKLDEYFFKIEYFKNFAWSVLIIAKKN